MNETTMAVRQAPNPDAKPAQVADAPTIAPEAKPEPAKPNGNGTELAVRPRQDIRPVEHKIAMFDTARFEHMGRIANAMASNSLLPEALTHYKDEALPFETVRANCLLIVNQAFNWEMDVFAVASSVSVVKGKLCYEGKLVSAVLEAKLGVRLQFHFIGDPAHASYRIYVSDRPFTDEIIAKIGNKPSVRIPGLRLWDGSVAEWTTGEKGPWNQPKNWPRMLIYRGTRDWTRIYESALMLGVYTDDEMSEEERRFERARDVSPQAAANAEAETPRRTTRAAPNPNAPAAQAEAKPLDGEIIEPEKEEPALDKHGRPKMPNPESQPTEFLGWVADRLAECDAEMLASTFTDSIEPHVTSDLYEDVQGLYKDRERELESAPGETTPEGIEKRLIAEALAIKNRIDLTRWMVAEGTRAALGELPEEKRNRVEKVIGRHTNDLKAAERK